MVLRLFHLPISHATIFFFHSFFYYLSALGQKIRLCVWQRKNLFYHFIVWMFLHNAGTQFLTLLKDIFCSKQIFLHFSFFHQASFFVAYPSGPPGDRRIQSFCRPSDIMWVSVQCHKYISLFHLSLLFSGHNCLVKKPKNKLTIRARGSTVKLQCYCSRVLLLKQFSRMVNDKNKGSSFTWLLVMQRRKSVNDILKTNENCHVCT